MSEKEITVTEARDERTRQNDPAGNAARQKENEVTSKSGIYTPSNPSKQRTMKEMNRAHTDDGMSEKCIDKQKNTHITRPSPTEKKSEKDKARQSEIMQEENKRRETVKEKALSVSSAPTKFPASPALSSAHSSQKYQAKQIEITDIFNRFRYAKTQNLHKERAGQSTAFEHKNRARKELDVSNTADFPLLSTRVDAEKNDTTHAARKKRHVTPRSQTGMKHEVRKWSVDAEKNTEEKENKRLSTLPFPASLLSFPSSLATREKSNNKTQSTQKGNSNIPENQPNDPIKHSGAPQAQHAEDVEEHTSPPDTSQQHEDPPNITEACATPPTQKTKQSDSGMDATSPQSPSVSIIPTNSPASPALLSGHSSQIDQAMQISTCADAEIYDTTHAAEKKSHVTSHSQIPSLSSSSQIDKQRDKKDQKVNTQSTQKEIRNEPRKQPNQPFKANSSLNTARPHGSAQPTAKGQQTAKQGNTSSSQTPTNSTKQDKVWMTDRDRELSEIEKNDSKEMSGTDIKMIDKQSEKEDWRANAKRSKENKKKYSAKGKPQSLPLTATPFLLPSPASRLSLTKYNYTPSQSSSLAKDGKGATYLADRERTSPTTAAQQPIAPPNTIKTYSMSHTQHTTQNINEINRTPLTQLSTRNTNETNTTPLTQPSAHKSPISHVHSTPPTKPPTHDSQLPLSLVRPQSIERNESKETQVKDKSGERKEEPMGDTDVEILEQPRAKHTLSHSAFIFQPNTASSSKQNTLSATQQAHPEKKVTRMQEKEKKKGAERTVLKNTGAKEKDDDRYFSSSSSHDDSLIPIRIAGMDRKNMRYRYLTLYDNGNWYHVDAEDLAVKAPMLVQAYEKHKVDSAEERSDVAEESTSERKETESIVHTGTKNAIDEKGEKKRIKYPSVPKAKKKSEEKKDMTESKASIEPPKIGDLPHFLPLSSPLFLWGAREAEDVIHDIEKVYETTIRWRKNIFKLPSGQTGKFFTQEIARLFTSYGEKSPLESIALKAVSIITPLLLQQPAGKPSYKKNKEHLDRRLGLWKDGKFDELLAEGDTIQKQLVTSKKAPNESTLAKRFATMVFNNNFKGAIALIANKGKGGVMPLNADTKKQMMDKHPKAEQADQSVLFKGPVPPSLQPIFYEKLDGDLIKKCVLRTQGSAGVSQQEDTLWHTMVTGFKDSSANLCNAVSGVAHRLATEYVDPIALEALLANRGIAIEKCPGLRPVGVGEIIRRVIGKAIMQVTGEKVQEAVGALQLCAGHPLGVESAVHSMRAFLDEDESEGILLMDADNAFNRLNRNVALWNIQYTCPAMKHILINFYRASTRILMNRDGFFELLSQEGTTQGCPLAMAMYALTLSPLVRELIPLCRQIWYADDASGCDDLIRLRTWYDTLCEKGPLYGYYPSPKKCVLVVKAGKLEAAKASFKDTGVTVSIEGSKDTGIEVNAQGARHLGAAVGTCKFKKHFISNKVDNWIESVKNLASIAESEPHAAFATFTHALQSQWTFLSRAMPDISDQFEPLEKVIRTVFLKALLKKDVNDTERDMIALPARLGGLGIPNPVNATHIAHVNSKFISMPLVKLILKQEFELDPRELSDETKMLRFIVDQKAEEMSKQMLQDVLGKASKVLKLAVQAASEKGASSWVTAVPTYTHETILHKRDFVDAIYIRYGWDLLNIPLECKCHEKFSLQHALDCKLGGLRTIQHNEARDTMAQFMKEAGYTQVETEPILQPLSGEEFFYKTANKDSEARSDIKCYSFYKHMRQAYFDIKVVSPYAKSNMNLKPAQLFRNAELSKNREYRERILQVEHGDFTPLVFTCAGGIAPQSQMVLKRLAERISEKQNIHVSQVAGLLRAKISFALLRTTLLCVRSSRSKKFCSEINIESAVSEARIDY